MESNNNLKYYKNDIKVLHQIPLFDNVTQYLNYAAKISPYTVALRIRRNNQLELWNYKQYKECVYKCAKSLLKLQLTETCSININSYNNPEWFFIYFACFYTKYKPTGIYITSSSSQCEHYFNVSDAEMVFVEDEERLKKYLEIKNNIPKCKAVVLMETLGGKYNNEDYSQLPFKVYKWNEFIQLGSDIDDETIDEISSTIKGDDIASLLFTSGTSSTPKCCLIMHKNYISNSFYAIQSFFDKVIYGKEVFISYLPLSHITDQVGNAIIPLLLHANVSFGDRDALKGSLVNSIKEFKPTVFIGVPRVYEKVQFKVEYEIKKMNTIKRQLIELGLRVGLDHTNKMKKGLSPSSYQYTIAYNLVIKKILDSIGLSNAGILVSGAAPLSNSTIQFFDSIGKPITSCYGLTETTGPSVVERPLYKMGSVGKINNGEVKIADDGEILKRGDFIFKGYYNDQDSTNIVIDSDGWYHTGDIGVLDNDGYLFITDRKKDIIITAGGENIAPSFIEGKLRLISGVEQAVVYGDKQKFIVCLITINLDYINQIIKSNNNNQMTLEQASNDPNVIKYFQDNIDIINKDLARVQTIKRFKILPNEFTEGNDQSELTATKKLRRKIVNQKYQNQFKQLYGDLYFE